MEDIIIANAKPLLKYDYNVIECYGLLTQVKITINPLDDNYMRLCMSPKTCICKKICRIKKGEII
jgi:hypothetical protein